VDPDAAAALSIETHIFDFDKDVYGKNVALEFLVRLRDERRFSGVTDQVAQIQKDILNARRYFHWLKHKSVNS
jgi:riboflavin kinase/FMN adenylyltransferase